MARGRRGTEFCITWSGMRQSEVTQKTKGSGWLTSPNTHFDFDHRLQVGTGRLFQVPDNRGGEGGCPGKDIV